MEIVSEPEISSPEEARDYLMKLHSILRYLGVSTCNMEDGSFRCDANISIRPIGCKELMAKVEVKNMNSFKAVYQALEYESRRQRKAVKEGEPIFQETRGWLDEKGETVSQRSKECADDYRYFPEPDLPPLIIDKTWIAKIKEKLPELPEARKNRFVAQYGLLLHDASVLTGSLKMADYFEECVKLAGKERAKAATTWILGDLSRLLNASGTGIGDTKVRPEHIADIIKLTGKNTISGPAAKTIIEETFHTGKSVDDIINDKDLRQVNDISEIQDLIKQAINDNPKAISDYRAGKEQALMFITGQVVKATSGRANPVAVKEILIEELGGK
jgi:aspartyl-tRNA(Asn)/glutamyl-tRNA(Gln) amidotransferase subunit B